MDTAADLDLRHVERSTISSAPIATPLNMGSAETSAFCSEARGPAMLDVVAGCHLEQPGTNSGSPPRRLEPEECDGFAPLHPYRVAGGDEGSSDASVSPRVAGVHEAQSDSFAGQIYLP